MKHLNQYIAEHIIKKKLDKPIDSKNHYKYFPETKEELIENIEELMQSDIYDFNCIDTSKITDMSSLFENIVIERNFDVSGWDVSNVSNMTNLFHECENFDCDLSKWNVSNVTSMMDMFRSCESFEGKGLEKWNVSKVENMRNMFTYCRKFDGKSIENWNVSNVTNMSSMFYSCFQLNCDLSK